MHTLAQLRAGELVGITRLQLAEDLTEFPEEIFTLADSLEILDLSNNRLHSLPCDFHRLHRLKIVFASNNCFEQLPSVLGQCSALEMIGFKANQITHVPEASLPLNTRWLILTDNQITQLPDTIGRLSRLQKLALAGNRLTQLPESMADCHALELVRLSANQLMQVPDWLFTLPRLAWLALAGNPWCQTPLGEDVTPLTRDADAVPVVDAAHITLTDVLGQGASGVIYHGVWLNNLSDMPETSNVAVKLFRGDVTSDGYPADELATCLQAGTHRNLIQVLAQLNQPEALGLVMELIPSDYRNLGLPPSLVTCTRDTFSASTHYSPETILTLAMQLADAMAHLHQNGVSHGDVYAHNIMFNEQSQLLFGDFGAATSLSRLPKKQQDGFEAIEVRAFGCLIDDLMSCSYDEERGSALALALDKLAVACMAPSVSLRPNFNELKCQLTKLSTH